MTDTNTAVVDPAQKYIDRVDLELPAGTEDQFTVQQKVTLGVFLTRTRQAAEYYNQANWEFDEAARNYRLAVDSGNPERITEAKAAFEAFVISVIGGKIENVRKADTDFRDRGRAVVDDLQKIVISHYTGVGPEESATPEQIAQAPRLLLEGPQKTIVRYFNTAWDKTFVDKEPDPIEALLRGLVDGQGPGSAQRRHLN